MAYKPPKQSIIDNDLKGVPSNEAVFEGLKLKLPKPTIDGTNGQLLARGASADDTSWVNPPSAGVSSVSATAPLASSGGSTPTISITQVAGDLDKVLVSNGTTASFQYAGLGSGGFGTNNVILGRSKPSFTSAANVTLVGATSGNAITSGTQHTCVGSAAGGAALITGTNSTAVGYNALITGATPSNATAIGANSTAGGDATFGGTAIGANANADNQSVAVGKSAVAQNARNVSIGRGATTGSGSDGVCIGANITLSNSGVFIYSVSGAQTQSVANSIGLYGACQVANSTLLGSTLNIYYNNHGVQRASVAALSENQIFANSYSTGGATNNGNASGGIFTINGAQGTGTGIGGDIRFKTSPPGAVSNNVQNALVEQVRITYDGKVGINTTAPSEKLEVSGNIKVTSGDVIIATAGDGLQIKSGANAKIGTASFVAQTVVTVNTTAVTANSLIFVTGQDGVDSYAVQNKIVGTSFEIHHVGGNTTAIVAWMIVEAI
jgi:stage V sporulation protein SpoVS